MEVNQLGKASMERQILEQFVQSVESVKAAELREPLYLLSSLYALTRIEADPWFLACGYITGAKHEGVTLMINNLCEQILPLASQFVEAFKVPESLLEKTAANGLERYKTLGQTSWPTPSELEHLRKTSSTSRSEQETSEENW
jgi:hypothetical protein